jgi:hypothetical protein
MLTATSAAGAGTAAETMAANKADIFKLLVMEVSIIMAWTKKICYNITLWSQARGGIKEQ